MGAHAAAGVQQDDQVAPGGAGGRLGRPYRPPAGGSRSSGALQVGAQRWRTLYSTRGLFRQLSRRSTFVARHITRRLALAGLASAPAALAAACGAAQTGAPAG